MDRETLINVAKTSLRTKAHSKLADILTEVGVCNMSYLQGMDSSATMVVTEMDRKLVVICDVFSVLTAFQSSCKL